MGPSAVFCSVVADRLDAPRVISSIVFNKSTPFKFTSSWC